MSTTVIEAEGLTKRYGRVAAVDGIDLTVNAGEVFGLLGPNGSGKTTTILMLLGLTEPSGGRVRVVGFDPMRQPLAVKRRVGYLPDQVGFYDFLTARENLAYTARLAGISKGRAALASPPRSRASGSMAWPTGACRPSPTACASASASPSSSSSSPRSRSSTSRPTGSTRPRPTSFSRWSASSAATA
jgi:ABC-type sugar transport system ATPase subunit